MRPKPFWNRISLLLRLFSSLVITQENLNVFLLFDILKNLQIFCKIAKRDNSMQLHKTFGDIV